MNRKKVAVIVGTRPEAVKLAPVIQALRRSRTLQPVVVSTSQHRDLVGPILNRFQIRMDHDLQVMRPAQKLWDLAGRLVSRLGEFLIHHPVSAMLVQGDTSSALYGGLAAFYHRLPLGHVEAGLRTGDHNHPFPEEMNRELLARLATWHFAPTSAAAQNLRREGFAAKRIHVTGNTVVDAMRWMARQPLAPSNAMWRTVTKRGRRVILVTCHRRENFGAPMQSVANAIRRLAAHNPPAFFVIPMHPNPAASNPLRQTLRDLDNVLLTEPLAYDAFLAVLRKAFLVMSDSGGVQEEATAMGRPVLVLREKTERPEGVRAGVLTLVGTDSRRIERACQQILDDPTRARGKARASRVFGDGRAAARIVRVLENALNS